MFGMPFHSISMHFPEWYRLVSLRSIEAENQERFFKHIKASTKTTNYQDDHLITNSLIRLQAKAAVGDLGKSWNTQESTISKEWSKLPKRTGTIITKAMVESDVARFAAHKRRISDYLLEGCWHTVEGGNWVFRDGSDDITPECSTIEPMHIR